MPDAEPMPDADPACGTTITAYELAVASHVTQCSPVVYATNPPTSGNHYGTWTKYQAYGAPVPRGFTVHNLEHGAVVISYDCPDGCDDEVAQLEAFVADWPQDERCTNGVRDRIVITPDPLLDTRFAAAAWGFALTSDCFDLAALTGFIQDHYARAPEDVCSDGVDVLSPELCP